MYKLFDSHSLSSARTPQEKEMLSRQIESTDEAIDRLVYELSPSGIIYGLTEEEIKIVEGLKYKKKLCLGTLVPDRAFSLGSFGLCGVGFSKNQI